MRDMRFTTGSEVYRLSFQYYMDPLVKETILRGPDTVIEVKETWRKHTVKALLERRLKGPVQWQLVAIATAECSRKDVYQRKVGREVALKKLLKLLHEVDHSLPGLTWAAYATRGVGGGG